MRGASDRAVVTSRRAAAPRGRALGGVPAPRRPGRGPHPAAREQARLEALHEYGLLDQPADEELAAVVRLAAAIAGVPTATLNLIDATRQCQLTTVGFEGADSPRDESMCEVSFRSGVLAHVPDASVHPDYAANPWVTGVRASVRFYASVPLVTPGGHALGTLCVFDDVPRELDARQQALLRDAAHVVVALFERRRQARELDAARTELQHSNADLARSNAELAEFAAVASHDLRTPLTVVEGYLELAEDDGDLSPRARAWVGQARGGVRRAVALTEALLAYARAGGASCTSEPVDLHAVLADVAADLSTHIAQAGACVEVTGTLPPVAGDPILVRQLLQNLVANALRYRSPERPPRVTLSARATGEPGVLEVTVTDNGQGIAAEHRERVFGLFATVPDLDGRASRARRSGIGLATCLRIVQRHGGRIWIEDAPTGADGGTSVRFTLPRAR